MKEQIPQPVLVSRTLQGKTKESNTASVTEVLQAYKNCTFQRQEVDEAELLQGKFETAQRDELEDDELLQGKLETTQRKETPNNTGMPDNLKAGVEQLSGLDMSDVKVHYNSAKPASVQAYAYTQGTNIHVASGQEKHLGHEAWHVVQQKQGRVQPPTTVGGMPVNDNAGLEKEADVMGGKAVQMKLEGNKSGAVANDIGQKKSSAGQSFGFVDNRPDAVAQRKIQEMTNNESEAFQLNEVANKSLQLRRKNRSKSGGHKKDKDPALAVTRMYGDGTYAIANEANDTGLHLEHYETPQLFWRGDDRTYGQVIKTGFNSKNERDNLSLEGSNVIKWRTGENQDDIDPDSGVCVAADVRGAAFFPLDKEAKYIYAVGLSNAINTYAIQKDVEKQDVGIDYESPERYPYDPTEDQSEDQSAIWQYQEYVAHRIMVQEILACYEIVRENFLKGTGEKTLAGMRFKLSHVWTNNQLSKQFSDAISKADYVANAYANFFPEKPTQYLSYYGIIETDIKEVKKAKNAKGAYERGDITVVDPVVDESVEDVYDRDVSEKQRKKQRTKNRRQKKRKKNRGKR